MASTEELVLDPSYLYEAADGDVEFMEAVLHEYVIGVAESIAELSSAFAARDRQTVRRAAHAVKGASASVGALRMRSVAARIECHEQDEPFESLGELLEELGREFTRFSTLVERGNPLLVAS